MNVTRGFVTQLKPQLSERDLAITETVGRSKLASSPTTAHSYDGEMNCACTESATNVQDCR